MDGDARAWGRPGERRMRCALFVDFDNVYSGLVKLDAEAAAVFAKAPGEWLRQLENGQDAEGGFVRRFLIRACYLNPSVYSDYRPYFTRAGFRVIDCPSLTNQGKSSADINLALDAVDALSSPTRYDEFLIFSADADFTPLALRCRAADRRVTVAIAGPAAGAYRAVADTVIAADQLAEMLTRPKAPSPEGEVLAAPADAERAGRDATRAFDTSAAPAPGDAAAIDAVLQLLRTADGPVTGAVVAQAAQHVDPTLPTTSWHGLGGFAAWLDQRVPEADRASRPPGYVWDRERFTEADLPARENIDLTPLQRQVVTVTDTPPLTTAQYATLLKALADDVNGRPFHRTETSKRVRDACHEAGVDVGRSSINFVIQGLLYAGAGLRPPVTAGYLAREWAGNVEGLCRGARMEFDAAGLAEIRAWAGGGLIADD